MWLKFRLMRVGGYVHKKLQTDSKTCDADKANPT